MSLLIQLYDGLQPARPSIGSTTDAHWELIEQCGHYNPVQRPTVEIVSSCIRIFYRDAIEQTTQSQLSIHRTRRLAHRIDGYETDSEDLARLTSPSNGNDMSRNVPRTRHQRYVKTIISIATFLMAMQHLINGHRSA